MRRQHTGQPPLAVNKTSAKSILVGVATAVILTTFLLLNCGNVPNHAGKPVSEWFQDLYSGVYGGTPKAEKFEAAYAEFARMETNAIPYLTKQLQYDRSGIRLKIVKFLRQHSTTKRFAMDLTWPPQHRSYAAVALREMGPKAEAAIPALLETWAHDDADVKINAMSALESILHGRYSTHGPNPLVIEEAGRRFPAVAAKLGINVGQTNLGR